MLVTILFLCGALPVNTGADPQVPVSPCIPFEAEPGCEAWVVSYDGPAGGDDFAASVATDPMGYRVYLAGQTTGSDLQPDLLLTALDAVVGSQLWAQAVGGLGPDVAAAVATSPDGQTVAIVGTISDLQGSTDIQTAAYDAETGTPLWSASYGVAGLTDSAAGLTFDPGGARVYVLGTLGDANGGTAMVTLAYATETGSLAWEAPLDAFPQDNQTAVSIAADGSRVYVVGTASAPEADTDVVLATYSGATGQSLWTNRSVETADETPESVSVNEALGRVLVSARKDSPTPGISLLAYDTGTGTLAWRQDRNGPEPSWPSPASLATQGSRVFVQGHVQEGMDVPTPACHLDPDCSTDLLALAFDVGSGAPLWEVRHGDPGTVERASALTIGAQDARLYAAGWSREAGGPRTPLAIAYNSFNGTTAWFAESATAGDMQPAAMVAGPMDERLYIVGGSWTGPQTRDAVALSFLLHPPTEPPSGLEDTLLLEEFWAFVRGGPAPLGQPITLTMGQVDDYAHRFLAFASDEERDPETNLTSFEAYLNSTGVSSAPSNVAEAIADLENRTAADAMWVAAKAVELLYESSPDLQADVAAGYIQPWDAQFFFDWVFAKKRVPDGWDAAMDELAPEPPPSDNETFPTDNSLEEQIQNLSALAPIVLPDESLPGHLVAPSPVIGPFAMAFPLHEYSTSPVSDASGSAPGSLMEVGVEPTGPLGALNAPAPAPRAPSIDRMLSTSAGPAFHYTACFEVDEAPPRCAAPAPWGVPTPMDSNGDGLPDLIARFSLTLDPLHPTGVSVDYSLVSIGLVPPAVHGFVVFDTPGPPVIPARSVHVAFGFDGRSSALPATSRLQVTLNDLVAASQGDLQISSNAEFALASASAAVTFAVATLVGNMTLPPAIGPPRPEVDPVVGSLRFTPVPPVFLLDARIRTTLNTSRNDVRLQVPVPVRADFRLMSQDTSKNSREEIAGTIDPLPTDLNATIASENGTRTSVSYRSSANLPYVSVDIDSTKNLAVPGDRQATAFVGHALPMSATLVLNGSLEVDYASTGRMGDAYVRVMNVSEGQAIGSTEFFGTNLPERIDFDLNDTEEDRLLIAYNASHRMDQAIVRVDTYAMGALDSRIEFHGASIPESVDLDVRTPGRNIDLLYEANQTMPSARVSVVDPEGFRIDADVTDVPAQLSFHMGYMKPTRSWFVHWAAPTPTTSAIVTAEFDDDDKVQKLAATLETLPASWSGLLSPNQLVLQSYAGPLAYADLTLTNHENVTRFPGPHVSFTYDEAKDEMDASLRATNMTRFELRRAGENLTFDAQANIDGSFFLHADVDSIDAEGDAEILRADVVLDPAPPHLFLEKKREAFRFESDANFDLDASVVVGDAVAAASVPAPPLVRGVSARDFASSTGTALKARVFLEGFPTLLAIDLGQGNVTLEGFRPPAVKNYLALDAHLDDVADGPLRVLARQNGLPSPVDLSARFTSTETAASNAVQLVYVASSPLGDFTADLTNHTSAARLEISNIPASLEVAAVFGPVVSQVSWDASASIQRVLVGARLPHIASLDGAVELRQIPASFDLAFGTQEDAALGYQGPWLDYHASTDTLDATAFVNADLFDDPQARARLSVTDLGHDSTIDYADEELVILSDPKTTRLEIHVWMEQTINKPFSGCWPADCPWLRLRWGDRFRIAPLIMEDAYISLESFSYLYIHLGLTTSIQGSYGRINLGWSSASTANYDVKIFLKIEVKIGPIKASKSLLDYRLSGLKPFRVYFHMATHHWSTGGDLLHWSTPIPCSIFPWRWFHVHVDVNPHPHRHENRWNTINVPKPAPGEGGAWLVTPNPDGLFDQRLMEAAAGLTNPVGGGIMLSVPKCKH